MKFRLLKNLEIKGRNHRKVGDTGEDPKFVDKLTSNPRLISDLCLCQRDFKEPSRK